MELPCCQIPGAESVFGLRRDMRPRRLLDRLERGHVRNVRFQDLVRLVEALGFEALRASGSHRIFGHQGVPELVNLQDVGGKAKAYQVRQVLSLIKRYNLFLER